jgi:hypothetical protein
LLYSNQICGKIFSLKRHSSGENAHFLIREQGIFRWTDLSSSFEEGDATGFGETFRSKTPTTDISAFFPVL